MPSQEPQNIYKSGHLLGIAHDGDDGWCWYLVKRSAEDPDRLEAVDCDGDQAGYETYEDAAHNGLVALARADGQPLEDERADPVVDDADGPEGD